MSLAQTFAAALPRLETPRLILRAPAPAGFEAYADFPPDWAQHLSISCSS